LRSPGDRALRRTLAATGIVAITLYFSVAAIVLGLRYGVLPNLDTFRPRIEAQLSARLGVPVRIGRLSGRWNGMEPSVSIDALTIHDRAGASALSVPHAVATLSWRSLPLLQPRLSGLVVEHPEVLAERAADGAVTVAGIRLALNGRGNDAFTTWLLRQGAIALRGGTLHWRDAQRQAPELTLTGIDLALLNEGTLHRIGLRAPPDGTVLHAPLDLRARFRHGLLTAPGKPANWSGEAYAASGSIDLPALGRYVPLRLDAQAGQLDARVWLSFDRGRVQALGGTLGGSALAVRVRPSLPRLEVPTFALGWDVRHRDDEYQLSVRNLRMELGGQPPLPDGTPITRLLRFSRFDAVLREPSVGHGLRIGLSGDSVDVGLLSEFALALPLPRTILTHLEQYRPQGLLNNFNAQWERVPPENPAAASEQQEIGEAPVLRYQLRAGLQNVSIASQAPPPGLTARGHPRMGIPGVDNLSGSVDLDDKHGVLAIDAHDAALTVQGLFDDPRLQFDRLQARMNWTTQPPAPPTNPQGHQRPAVDVRLTSLAAHNADGDVTATGSYRNAGSGRGTLQLKAEFAQLKTSQVPRYLPTSISGKLRAYLDHAISGGITRHAVVEVDGDLDKFPFEREPRSGMFHVIAPFTGASFDPTAWPARRTVDGTLANWPRLDDVSGIFEVRQNKMRFDIDRARYRNVTISQVAGRIDDLGSRASDLTIDGRAAGPLDDMLHYTSNSPIAAVSHHRIEHLAGRGDASLELHVSVPRHEQPHIAVRGSLKLANNDVTYDALPPVTNLSGDIDFTEHSLSLSQTAGQFLGGEIHGDGGLNPDGSIALAVHGRIATEAARGLYPQGAPAMLLRRLSGSAPYAISIRGARKSIPQVVATSDLSGLGIDLPAPLHKSPGESLPLRASLNPVEPAAPVAEGAADAAALPLMRLDASLGPLTAVFLTRGAKQPQIVRGALGLNRPAKLPREGISALLDMPRLDGDAWRATLHQLGEAARESRAAHARDARSAPPRTVVAWGSLAPLAPTRIEARVGSLTLLGRQWDDIALDAAKNSGTWQASLRSAQATGTASWRAPTAGAPYGAVTARFERLSVPAALKHAPGVADPAQAQTDDVLNDPPNGFPSIDVIVGDLLVDAHDLGRLQVAARNLDDAGVPVWQVDKLELSNPAATLTAAANWRAQPAGARAPQDGTRRTALAFKVDIKDGGKLLERFGLPRTLRDGAGSVTGNVSWAGGPGHIDYPTLSGDMKLDLKHGQILSVKPGIAKFLGVLSLQSVARFLTLDFRSVLGAGLPFSTFTGSGTIRNGIARTDDVEMRASPARISMRGTADLIKEQQDLRVTVIPTLHAGTATLAAAVINPLLGVGSFVAQMLLSESIGKSFERQYDITGSWSNPKIQRLNHVQGELASPARTAGP
jgi:uncharacterized protein (TIGR02099 family)